MYIVIQAFLEWIISRMNHLKRHEDSIHKKIKYYCIECGQQFAGREGLKSNINIVDNSLVCNSAKYSCSQWVFETRHQSSLFNHMKSIHKDIKHACTQCDYKANTQGNLKLHIKSKHEGVNIVVMNVIIKQVER